MAEATTNIGPGGTYGIVSVSLADVVSGGYPTQWPFSFSAIVMDSVSFNDNAPSENDLYVEDIDTIYATLKSDEGSKGFTLDTYDLSADAFMYLQGFTETDGWMAEPVKIPELVQAVQIVTRDFGDFPSKTFQWGKMKISVTKAGTIGKSGFPNFHLEFKQQAHLDANGTPVSGHRWKLTDNVNAASVAAPVFFPAAWASGSSLSVQLDCETPSATIKYSLDGSDPANGSTYSSGTPITLSATTTIKAVAIKSGVKSAVSIKTYTKPS